MSDDDNEYEHIVVDNGSSMMKCGFAGDDAPRAVFPSVVGRPRQHSMMPGVGGDVYVGDEAWWGPRRMIVVRKPIQRGIVTNWEDMESIWHHMFYNELRVEPEKDKVLLTESLQNPSSNREKTAQIMFETFSVDGLHFKSAPELSIYASGLLNGCVLDVGGGFTTSVSIVDGAAVPRSIRQLDFGGELLSEHFTNLLNEAGHSFTTSAEKEITNDMKEKMGYVSTDLEHEMRRASIAKLCSGTAKTHADTTERRQGQYELPDGAIIELHGKHRSVLFGCTEPLFSPAFLPAHLGKQGSSSSTAPCAATLREAGVERKTACPGVAAMVASSINEVDPSRRAEMVRNIVLAGGSSLFPGFADRLKVDVSNLLETDRSVNVVAPAERKYSAWIGGSILASLTSSQSIWVTKEQYDEEGPSAIHAKPARQVNQ